MTDETFVVVGKTGDTNQAWESLQTMGTRIPVGKANEVTKVPRISRMNSML